MAGIRTPLPLSQLRDTAPEMMTQLEGVRERLEKHYRDMQDMEFTIQQGRLFLLQTRNGKRTGPAAVKVAIDMVAEGLISRDEAIGRVTADLLDQCLHPMIKPAARPSATVLATGLNASPGAATGQVVFTAEAAEEWAAQGKRVLLVRRETSPEDIGGMHAAQGILTATGGKTSHAAVVARGMGTPCVAGCKEVVISGTSASIDGFAVNEGQLLTIDGGTGEVFDGELPLIKPKVAGDLAAFLEWTDSVRAGASREGIEGFGIRTNADLPRDAQVAREFGAEGIGLCRTEHMFFEEGKLEIFQEMIVAEDAEARKAALDRLLPLQREDFAGIFQAMDGFPVTVRLLDPPLHEFVPKTEADVEALAATSGVPLDRLKAKIEALHEMNPMLGHRGCRLGITYPEIYDMQVRAIMEAACAVAAGGASVLPEIMIPLVGTVEELSRLRARAENVAADVAGGRGGRGRVPDRHHDRDSARRGHRGPGGGGGRLLLLRHQRPHPDDVRLLARRCRGVSPRVRREGHPGARSVPGAGPGGRRRGGGDGRAARPHHQAGPEDGHLRRARRRPVVDRVLLPGGDELRLLLPLPRPYRPPRGRPRRVGHLTVAVTIARPHRSNCLTVAVGSTHCSGSGRNRTAPRQQSSTRPQTGAGRTACVRSSARRWRSGSVSACSVARTPTGPRSGFW